MYYFLLLESNETLLLQVLQLGAILLLLQYAGYVMTHLCCHVCCPACMFSA